VAHARGRPAAGRVFGRPRGARRDLGPLLAPPAEASA
jgi:hypothetical protein